MSDKSFGDHINRNIVKNPLLSSAVTGLSLEDLTHKAVLLPATPTQGQVTRLDQQQGSQASTLAHAEHDNPIHPSGDAFSHIPLSNTPSNIKLNTPSNIKLNILDSQNNDKYRTTIATQSKASMKSEDDFDVNEYIARLQGTRYVSAPLHSHIKDDQNANLEAEESLEEINLNESQNDPVEVQQSLTADIAQNFSQLPTVLPHVASAVFSSFSNMLSMKSREQTPDDPKVVTGYQDVQFERPECGVPLMGVEDNAPKDFGLPPKEPPISGVSSYRISSKKKYAQIPGLTSGDNAQRTNNPPFFAPPTVTASVEKIGVIDVAISQNNPPYNTPIGPEKEAYKPAEAFSVAQEGISTQKTHTYDIFQPYDYANASSGVSTFTPATDNRNVCSTYNISENSDNIHTGNDRSNVFASNTNAQPNFFRQNDQKQDETAGMQPGPPIIPPPPMFSNIRKDSQTSGKSVLPPSVARRISANQPLIKPQIIPTQTIPENFFIPAAIPDTSNQSGNISSAMPSSLPSSITPMDQAQQASLPDMNLPTSSKADPISFFTPSSHTQSSEAPLFISPNDKPSAIGSPFFELKKGPHGTVADYHVPPPPTVVTESTLPPSILKPIIPTACSIESNAFAPLLASNLLSTVGTLKAPQAYDPMMPPQKQSQDPHTITQYPVDYIPEPVKPIMEPPKASGNLNFRMTKKRPQYYSGPIEGVGDISNNVKPVIPPVIPSGPPADANAYQGPLFTPTQQPQTVEPYAVQNLEASVPFDINKPIEPEIQPFPTFDINKPQNYNEYSTAFDVSRPPMEPFDTPKQETKGFGIIGSLKSKLSSIDINKIQSTVTTFFDPAYNDAKVESTAQETAFYSQQQYSQHSHDKGNFEITVPHVDQNQYGYQSGYSYDPNNQYYQAQSTYNYSQNEGQTASSYFTSPNYTSQQVYPDLAVVKTQEPASTSYSHENIPQNKETLSCHKTESVDVVNFFNPAAIQEQMNLNPVIANKESNDTAITNIFTSASFNLQPHGVIGDVPQSINPQIEVQKDLKHFTDSTNKPTAFFDGAFVADNRAITLDHVVPKSQIELVQDKQPFSQIFAPATSFFDSPISAEAGAAPKTNELTDKIAELALAEEIAIRNTPFQAVDLPVPNVETSSILKVVGIKPVTTSSQNNMLDQSLHKEKEPPEEKRSLLESLTEKDYIAGVSNVPLFGLSAMIADKSREMSETDIKNVTLFDVPKDSKPHLEKQTSFDFFEDETPENKHVPKTVGLSITDVKNVLLIEPPQENLGTILKRNASSSLLKDLAEVEVKSENLSQDRDSSWNLDAAIVTSKDNVNILFDRRASGFFDHLLPSENLKEGKDPENVETTEQASDFNICETCREVNVPEDKENENVTKQLIENINSSIQLSNPVEAPFTESIASNEDLEFENRLDDITLLTEETYETLQVQSATELLDDIPASNVNSYGWTAEQLAYASMASVDQSFGNIGAADSNEFGFKSNQYNTATDPEYTFKIDPNAIGFFGDNSLFFDNVPNNASDEIKAEFKTSHDDISVPPRQMSLPSAPPVEDDSKSDETGVLDVHSIEQDAKKDFPLEEEFIIEPSETDDDKIEYRERKKSSEDSMHDTFTDRIEKFKNKVGTDSKDDLFDYNATLPPKTMASYFDTGNYAVETHYRNSLTSPTNINAFQEHSLRIPPGFEDEFNRRLSELSSSGKHKEPYIPETSTQTRTTITPTFSTAHDKVDVDAIGFKTNEESSTNPLAQAFSTTNEVIMDHTQTINASNETKEPNSAQQSALQDPINFFSPNTEPQPTTEAETFNRLASYFSMPPPQPDHSKSFFELSQSQNHYRHGIQSDTNKNRTDPNDKTRLDQISDINKKQADKNENLKSLMQDLTSPQNIKFDPIVKTVNYFSVEFENVEAIPKAKNIAPNVKSKEDLDSSNKKQNKIDSPINIDKTNDDNFIDNSNGIIKDEDCINIIDSCEYCNKLDTKDYKVRTSANDSDTKESDGKMSDKESKQERSVAVDFGNYTLDDESKEHVTVLHESRSSSEYSPVRHHWFYRVDVEDKSVWRGFSMTDSNALEHAYRSPDLKDDTLVATDGGRFDVNVVGRLRIAVYWKEKPTNVRRCSWFYKGTTDARYVPYTEVVADKLEEEYRHGVTTGEWHRRLVLPNNELVVMHGPAVMVHFLHGGVADSFSSPPFLLGKRVYRNPPAIRVARDQSNTIDHLMFMVHGAGEYKRNMDASTSRPRVVRRGHEESEIEDPEPSSIDHLLLLCHGVGSACDMRFRSVEEVVEDFRTTSLQLLQSHYRNSYDNGIVSRIEVLPISWHEQLHAGESGVDKRLNKVTLESIPRLRAFTNHTVLDVLFYTSPVYHQTIINTVCYELNRIYSLFQQRNPNFKGSVSLGGHSLGSVILYDLLCHQTPEVPIGQKSSAEKTYLPGTTEKEAILDKYPQLAFPPAALYALGSPIAIFECIRGVESLGMDFSLPTCKNFFNIFHPYDPIAYRIEPLINPLLQDAKPFLIPHHKGRKRMHLELKDTMVRVGADLKQKLLESLRTTWNKWKSSPPPDGQLEKVVEEEMEKEQLCDEVKEELINSELTSPEMLGKLNCGRRIDYVLQEAPLEMMNEYLFAMSSHVGYWESEDTMLLMLREIYSSLGVEPDCTVPQQSLTVTRTRQDEATIVNEKEYPSTSRGGS